MPKVTDLKSQIKSPDRISVYIDDVFSFGLGIWQVGSLGLKIGKELTTEEISELKSDAEFGKLHDRSLRWLAIRKRSEWEVSDYLRKKSDNKLLRERVQQTLTEKGYVNDEDFAASWIQNRRQTKAISRRKLEQELRAKRVEQSVISKVLSHDEVSDEQSIQQMIIKKRRQSRYKDNQKLMQYLSRQGYGYSEIKQALEQD